MQSVLELEVGAVDQVTERTYTQAVMVRWGRESDLRHISELGLTVIHGNWNGVAEGKGQR